MRELFLLFLLLPFFSYSQWGSIDETFGVNGKSSVPIPPNFLPNYNVNSVIQNEHESLFVIGNYTVQDEIHENYRKVFFSKFSENGILDETFGTNGFVSIEIPNGSTLANSFIATNDNHIVVVGNWTSFESESTAQMFLLKIDLNGQIVQDFGDNGIYMSQNLEYENGLVVLQDEDSNFLIAGQRYEDIYMNYKYYVLSKVSSSGNLMTDFGTNGYVSEIIATEVTPSGLKIVDNQIYMVGVALGVPHQSPIDHDILLKRFDLNGNVDLSFGINGTVLKSLENTDIDALSMDFDANGNIYVGGTIYNQTIQDNFYVAKFRNDGSVADEFGNDGIAYFVSGRDYGYDVHFVSENNIILTGFQFDSTDTQFKLMSVNSVGELNNSFGENGFITTNVVDGMRDHAIKSILVEGNKILMLGKSGSLTISMVRYNVENNMNVHDNNSLNNVSINPNPTSNSFKIVGLEGNQNLVQILDLSGKIVKEFKSISTHHTLELGAISKGTYLVKIHSGNKIHSKKLLVK